MLEKIYSPLLFLLLLLKKLFLDLDFTFYFYIYMRSNFHSECCVRGKKEDPLHFTALSLNYENRVLKFTLFFRKVDSIPYLYYGNIGVGLIAFPCRTLYLDLFVVVKRAYLVCTSLTPLFLFWNLIRKINEVFTHIYVHEREILFTSSFAFSHTLSLSFFLLNLSNWEQRFHFTLLYRFFI